MSESLKIIGIRKAPVGVELPGPYTEAAAKEKPAGISAGPFNSEAAF